MTNDISQLPIKELLSDKDSYIIPMYQRNYAWGEGEITQLIQDVIDYLPKKHNYYIGTLVVFERPDGKFEVIDGQQRLTTLSLLAAYLKNEITDLPEKPNLHFDSRPNSQNTLDAIFDNKIADLIAALPEETNAAILGGYRSIKDILRQKLRENKIQPQNFSNFLFYKVQIMRVKVPEDTDLNHYFEIMNNRGEQLEKHEVLKARMMNVLEDKKHRSCLHMVWEACANMEKYVQMGFSPEQRRACFGETWDRFEVKNFEELQEEISSEEPKNDNDLEQTLDEIIEQKSSSHGSEGEESSERFNTVISFSNFLLHVLRIQTNKDVPLDDKQLISKFEEHILKETGAAEKVKKFIFDLLHCKFLYDQYVIKREFIKGKDTWSLKRLSKSEGEKPYYKNTFGQDDEDGNHASENNKDDNKSILMLLSAFHVSNPSQNYKHWLDGALVYLYRESTASIDRESTASIDPTKYLQYLEGLANSFVFDRFLSANGRLDYFKMIFTNKDECQTTKNVPKKWDETKLSFGKIENNFVFNFLDYLLWKKYQMGDSIVKKVEVEKVKKVKEHEFTFRSSVEHYYPQNPKERKLDKKILDSFGNLCLISHSKNSQLSNFMPEDKKKHYPDDTFDSVKQHLMMECEPWDAESIKKHFEEMKTVLLSALEEDKSPETQ